MIHQSIRGQLTHKYHHILVFRIDTVNEGMMKTELNVGVVLSV